MFTNLDDIKQLHLHIRKHPQQFIRFAEFCMTNGHSILHLLLSKVVLTSNQYQKLLKLAVKYDQVEYVEQVLDYVKTVPSTVYEMLVEKKDYQLLDIIAEKHSSEQLYELIIGYHDSKALEILLQYVDMDTLLDYVIQQNWIEGIVFLLDNVKQISTEQLNHLLYLHQQNITNHLMTKYPEQIFEVIKANNCILHFIHFVTGKYHEKLNTNILTNLIAENNYKLILVGLELGLTVDKDILFNCLGLRNHVIKKGNVIDVACLTHCGFNFNNEDLVDIYRYNKHRQQLMFLFLKTGYYHPDILEQAIVARDINIISMLIKLGCIPTPRHIELLEIPQFNSSIDFTKDVIIFFRRLFWLARIRRKSYYRSPLRYHNFIQGKTLLQASRWQQLAPGPIYYQELREIAKAAGINEKDTKRNVCAQLALQMEHYSEKMYDTVYAENTHTLSSNPIEIIPKDKMVLHEEGGKRFIFELGDFVTDVADGKPLKNHYTSTPLPQELVEDISVRLKYYDNVGVDIKVYTLEDIHSPHITVEMSEQTRFFSLIGHTYASDNVEDNFEDIVDAFGQFSIVTPSQLVYILIPLDKVERIKRLFCILNINIKYWVGDLYKFLTNAILSELL